MCLGLGNSRAALSICWMEYSPLEILHMEPVQGDYSHSRTSFFPNDRLGRVAAVHFHDFGCSMGTSSRSVTVLEMTIAKRCLW